MLKRNAKLSTLVILFVLTLALAPWFGSVAIHPWNLWSGQATEQDVFILVSLRIPRVLLGLATGMGLGLSGLVLQTLLRNELADPFTLGIGGGAAFGAVVAIALGLGVGGWFFSPVSFVAFLGALSAILIVLSLSRGLTGLDPSRLILTGITLQYLFASVVLILHYLASLFESQQILHWLIGGLQIQGYEVFAQILPFWLLGVGLLFPTRADLNLLWMGEEYAHSKGVAIRSVKTRVFLGAALIAGSLISVVGPIGFVGLMAPHFSKILFGWDHRRNFWTTLMIGGILLLWCDVLSRVVLAPMELPVGALTALLGGPYLIFLLYRTKMGWTLRGPNSTQDQ